MLGMAFMIFFSALAAWTIPADVPGTVAEGAMLIVVLQGLVFNAIVIGYGIAWAIRNRQTIRDYLADLRN